MNKEQSLQFLKNNRTLNKGKITVKNMLNINCINNKQKNNAKKITNIPLDKFISKKFNDIKKINEINTKEKKKDNKINKKLIKKKRNFSYTHNFNTNNCTINNNINYSNNNNINVNMINNNININNNKFLTKQNNKYDNSKNKLKKKMILSDLNPNFYNTNITSLNTEISKFTGDNNITSYFDINNKNLLFDKQNKNNSNKNINIIKNNEKLMSTNNSNYREYPKKSEENKNRTKIIFINYQNFRRNNTRLQNNNSQTQIQNNLNNKGKLYHQLPKRKYNNSQTNIIMNKMKKSFYTTYLYTGLSNSKNDLQKTFKYNSNNSTLNKNSQNKKYFNLSKDNSILNLTGSFNSRKHIFTDGINLFFDNNESDLNYNKIIKKNKSSFLENRKTTADIHLKSIKDLLSNKFIQDLNNIQNNLERNLNKNIYNKSNIKKFKLIKNAFENFLKILNQNVLKNTYNIIVNFLKKIYIGYNELITSLSTENQKLKNLNNNLEIKKEKIEKKYTDLEGLIQEKQEKLKVLEQKFFSLINYINKNTNLKDYSVSFDKDFTLKGKTVDEGEIISTIEEVEQDVTKGKIYKMNKNNLDDLDALYFFDKIKMAPQRSYSGMPSLNLFKKLKNTNKKEDEAMVKNKIGIINISDIKFTSNYFNKFKQAFENIE